MPRKVSVRMSKEMPRAVMAFVPDPHGIVAQHDVPLVHLQVHHGDNGFKPSRLKNAHSVMVSEDDIYPSIETLRKFDDPISLPLDIAPEYGKIAEVIDDIAGGDNGVPVCDQCLIHEI